MRAVVANRYLAKQILNFACSSSFGQCARIVDIPTPQISDSEILVRVRAVALNPVDNKSIDFLSPNKSIIGCDYAGEVVKVGSDMVGRWNVGDRVAGFVHGGQYPDVGSFAEYLKVDGELAWPIPDATTMSEAATYGIPAVTAVLALAHLDVSWEDILSGATRQSSADSSILIYSGGSNVGLFAIQLAKRAGLHVVVTASPRSFDLVKSYGADSVFDYRSPTAASEISKAYPDITKALDCFSEGNSSQFCAEVLKRGRVITLLDQGKPKKAEIEFKSLMVFTVFGKPFSLLSPLGPAFPVVPDDRDSLRRFYASLSQLCDRALKPPPVTALGGGLDAVLDGLERLRKGEAHGTKLVVELP
jgi:NADPH:quinone reductase-like Zn-dependent oxidoreductase